MSAVLAIWLLATARLAAVLWVQVLWRTVVPAWGLIAVGIAAALAMLVRPLDPMSDLAVPQLVGLVGLEVVLGLVIGSVATLPGYALLGAMSVSALVLRVPPRPIVGLSIVLALAVALGLGLHRPLVTALLETFAMLPLGDPGGWLRVGEASGLATLTRAAHAMLLLALALATPVLLTAAVADLVTRLVGHGPGPIPAAVAPLEVWLRAAGGILALGASWASYGHVWAESIGLTAR